MDKIRPWLYIAGYYSANPAQGIANAAEVFNDAWDMGWFPIIPHVNFLLDMVSPHSSDFWYDYDLYLLKRCQGLYVCPDSRTKSSTGVTQEINFARKFNIAVYDGQIPRVSNH